MRLDGDFSRDHFDPLFDTKRPPPVTVAELVAQFVELKAEEGAAQKLSLKNMDRVRANAALIEEILGSGTLVGDVGWDVCRKALSTLASVPPNRTKIYRDLPLSEAIERAKAAGEPTLSHITQGQYLRTFKELLDLAVNKQLIAKNYASDMQPLRREALAADEKRVPFDDDQLRQFFGSAYYSDCALGKNSISPRGQGMAVLDAAAQRLHGHETERNLSVTHRRSAPNGQRYVLHRHRRDRRRR